jgi:hypothetical protein
VWIDGGDPLYCDEHGLDRIPFVSVIPEGNREYAEPERRSEPLLYGVYQSGIWQRQNMMLSALFTNMSALISAQFIHNQGTAGATIEIDHSVVGDIIEVEPGGQLSPMAKQVVDPQILAVWQMAGRIFEESTIYGQAMGQPVGSNAAYAMVSLLAQSGRLPLVGVQEMLGMALAELMDIALSWAKKDGLMVGDFDAREMPDNLGITCNVDVDLPQDKLQAANIARMISTGQDPLVSKDWARSNVLNVEQGDTMQRDIWAEQMAGLMVQTMAQQMVQKMQQPQPQPGPGMPPGGQGMPPEMMQQMMMQQQQGEMPQGENGQTIPQGLPPEMAGEVPPTMPPGMNGEMPPGMAGGMP